MFWSDSVSLETPPYEISLVRGVLVDESRNGRRVPYKVYVPRDIDGKNPAVIWSHGLGGSRDGAGFISRFLASHGIFVINIQHDGTDTSMWMGKPGHPWDAIRATKVTWDHTYQRILDVPFVLDSLLAGHIEDEILGKIDLDRLGMSGHSYGALTTQVMAGQTLVSPSGDTLRFHENRLKAKLAYSPAPSDFQDKGGLPYEGINRPIFFMTGTQDSSPISGKDYKHRLDIFENTSAENKSLLVIDGADHMIFSGSRGQLPGYDEIPRHEDIIRIFSLAWWQAALNEDEAALSWLDEEHKVFLASDGVFHK